MGFVVVLFSPFDRAKRRAYCTGTAVRCGISTVENNEAACASEATTMPPMQFNRGRSFVIPEILIFIEWPCISCRNERLAGRKWS